MAGGRQHPCGSQCLTLRARCLLHSNMVSQLIDCGRIETTVPKAKELRRVADQMVTLGKDGTLNARRRAAAVVTTDSAMHKVCSSREEMAWHSLFLFRTCLIQSVELP